MENFDSMMTERATRESLLVPLFVAVFGYLVFRGERKMPGDDRRRVDIALGRSKDNPRILVEAKRRGTPLTAEDEQQALGYLKTLSHASS